MLRFQRLYSSVSARCGHHLLKKYAPGDVLHGYRVQRVMPLPDYNMTAVALKHEASGSQHLHIDTVENGDGNNVFSVAFRTQPPDDTGVAHILEHTTLCGSEKFPIHDPFFKMLNKSVANFMNAMTGPDYTFYPFATTNEKDYMNLMKVYLDSTLSPLLTEQDFIQEGWRLENVDVNDPRSPLTFKGVVYNEMKGQISNNDYFFYSQFQKHFYPSLNNSGGDPHFITDLNHTDLVNFHRLNYNPSNSRTFSYGNFPLVNTLSTLNNEFSKIKSFNAKNNNKVLSPIDLNNQDKHVRVKGPFEQMLPPDKQLKTSLAWLCGSTKDVYETFLLKVLGNILLEGQSSPFYQTLVESGLGTDFTVNTGMESQTESNFLCVGVQGINEKDLIKFKDTVVNTIQDFKKNPIDKLKVKAIIEQIELNKKDHKPDFGLQLLYSILPGWSNGIDPLEALNFEKIIDRFKKDFDKEGDLLLFNLIDKYVLNQPNFQFTMEGDEEFAKSLDLQEEAKLKEKISKLSKSDQNEIYQRGLELKSKQERVEDLSCLPSLNVKNDIERSGKNYPISINGDTMIRLTDTNGISYLRGKIDLNDLIPRDLYPYLTLYVDSLTSLGTKDQPFKDIENEIKLNTGGVSTQINVSNNPFDLNPQLSLNFSGWSLNSKVNEVVNIWDKLILNTDFQANRDNLKIMIKMMASSAMSAVSESGHSFAMRYAGAYNSKVKSINETLNGIEQLNFIMKLNKIVESDDEALFENEIIGKLNLLKNIIQETRNRIKFFITTDSNEQVSVINQELSLFKSKFQNYTDGNKFIKTSDYPLLINPKKTPILLSFPFQTHYSALSQLTKLPYLHPDTVPLSLVSNILSSKYFHREIRERNGAYGAGMSYDSMDGLISYFSYRDPNPMESLRVFQSINEELISKLDEVDMNDGKLRMFQNIDSPISKRSEGIWNFNNGVSDRMRQDRRERLLATERGDLQRVVDKYILRGDKTFAGQQVVVGSVIDGVTEAPEWRVKSLDLE